MTEPDPIRPGRFRTLSARLLMLTLAYVLLSEMLIFVPAVAHFRADYLKDKIASARLAALAVEAAPAKMVSQALANELLAQAGAHGIVLHKPDMTTLMLDSDMPPAVDLTYDLRQCSEADLIRDALMTLRRSGNLVLRVLDTAPGQSGGAVEVLLDEAPLRSAMWAFGGRIFVISLVLSLATGALLYLSLQYLFAAPMRRMTVSMMAFREDPEDATRGMVPGARSDELGLAERELARLQETVRQALRHKTRLAALGTAVTKINHDLRNILSTARLLSDGLADSDAPEVKRVAPRLLAAIDRAVALCGATLDFTREGAPPLRRERFVLGELVEELAEFLGLNGEGGPELVNRVPPDLMVAADRAQLHRVLMNLCGNAAEAGARRVTISAEPGRGRTIITIEDDGPGLPPKARQHLFQPFTGSARAGGTGLGLAVAREVMRAHGGEIVLAESGATGTVFRLTLPEAAPAELPAVSSDLIEREDQRL